MTTIYHNPRCSKSRAALALLEENQVSPEIVLYLDNPPDARTVADILKKLGMSATDIIRRSESVYREFITRNNNPCERDLIQLIVENPVLLQRPIVVRGKRAAIGRPPENILHLIQN